MRALVFGLCVLGSICIATHAFSQAEGESTESASDSSGGGRGVEIGGLAGLLMPGSFPGTDEVYPSVGFHLGFPVLSSTLETGFLLGVQEDRLINDKNNYLLFIPLQFRKDMNLMGNFLYGSLGAHGVYYSTYYSSGRNIQDFAVGLALGGGLIMPGKTVSVRLDMRGFIHPGATVLVSLFVYTKI